MYQVDQIDSETIKLLPSVETVQIAIKTGVIIQFYKSTVIVFRDQY